MVPASDAAASMTSNSEGRSRTVAGFKVLRVIFGMKKMARVPRARVTAKVLPKEMTDFGNTLSLTKLSGQESHSSRH